MKEGMEDVKEERIRADEDDASLDDGFKKITCSTNRDKLQKKYDKLKRIYLKLKQKYEEREAQLKIETATKHSDEPDEVIIIKDEIEDDYESRSFFTEIPNAQIIEKKNLTTIAPKRKQRKSIFRAVVLENPTDIPEESCSRRHGTSGAVKSPSPHLHVESFDQAFTGGQSMDFEDLNIKDGKKPGGRRKSSRPRKTMEKTENSVDRQVKDNEDTLDYFSLISEPEDGKEENDEAYFEIDNGDVNDGDHDDEPEKKKRKKKCSKQKMKLKPKDKSKDKEKKEPQVFRCDICGKFLSSKPILEKHKRIHTGERPYQCHICGKSFNSLSSFNNHTRIHNGIKPYQCRYCDKCFTETSQRTTHERTHTGEKPYMCDLCGGRFSLRSSLVRHRRIHTGEKPYVCSECGAAYCQYTQLSHHKKKCGRFALHPSLPTMTPLRYQADLSDTSNEKNLAEPSSNQDRSAEHSLYQSTTAETGNDKCSKRDSFQGKCDENLGDDAGVDGVKVETKTNASKDEPLSGDKSEKRDPHSNLGISLQNGESYLSQCSQGISDKDAMFHDSLSNFQHLQPYMHALNHPAANMHSFPSHDVVAREAVERFSSLHSSWFLNNTQTG